MSCVLSHAHRVHGRHALLAVHEGGEQNRRRRGVAQVVEHHEELAPHWEAEALDLLAHVVIQPLAEGGAEAKEDAERIGQQEGVPLLLRRDHAQHDEGEVPIRVGLRMRAVIVASSVPPQKNGKGTWLVGTDAHSSTT